MTAEEPPPTPTPPPTRQKDPKKQAAGRAGAAARKAKQDRLLQELREAKEKVRQAPAADAPTEPEPEPPRRTETREPSAQNWAPVAVGAAAVAGVVLLARLCAPGASKPSAGCVSAVPAPPAQSRAPPAAQHLKAEPDPFHME